MKQKHTQTQNATKSEKRGGEEEKENERKQKKEMSAGLGGVAASEDCTSNGQLDRSFVKWSKMELAGGETAYLIGEQSMDKTRPILVHFGLQEERIVLCGCCLATYTVGEGSTIRDVGNWISRHWKGFPTGSGDRIPAHAVCDRVTTVNISNVIAESIGWKSIKQVLPAFKGNQRERKVLFEERWLRIFFTDHYVSSLERKENIPICSSCYREVLNESSTCCCSGMRVIKVTQLRVRQNMKTLYCTSDSAILEEQRQLRTQKNASAVPSVESNTSATSLQSSHQVQPMSVSASSVSSSLLPQGVIGTPVQLFLRQHLDGSNEGPVQLFVMQSSSAACGQGIGSFMPITIATNSTTPSSKPPMMPGSASTFGNASPVQIDWTSNFPTTSVPSPAIEAIPIKWDNPSDLETPAMGFGNKRTVLTAGLGSETKRQQILHDSNMENSIGVASVKLLDLFGSPFDGRNAKLKAKSKTQPSTATDCVLEIFKIDRKTLTLNDQVNFAKLHEYDRTSSKDKLLLRIAEVCMEMLVNNVQRLDDDMLIVYVSKLPRLVGNHVGYYSDTDSHGGDSDPRNASLREFYPSVDTYKKRVKVLFSILKMYLARPDLPGHLVMTKSIQALEECASLADLTDADDGAPPVQFFRQENLASTFVCIILILDYFARTDGGVISSFCKPFLFSMNLRERKYQADAFDEDDVEALLEEQETEVDGATTTMAPPTLATTPSTVAQSSASKLQKLRNPATVRKDVGNVLSILKYIVIFRLFIHDSKCQEFLQQLVKFREQGQGDSNLTKQLESFIIECASATPIEILMETYYQHTSLSQLGTIIKRLHETEDMLPHQVNMWNLTTINNQGPVFKNGKMSFDLKSWTGAGNAVMKHAFNTLRELCDLDDTRAHDPITFTNCWAALSDRPSPDHFRIISSDFNGACPRLETNDSCVQLLRTRLNAARQANPVRFVTLASQFRDELLGLISLMGTSALRVGDILELRRGLSSNDPGNLIGDISERGEAKLIIMLYAQKTSVTGISHLPPTVSRLILILLDLIAPIVADILVSKILSQSNHHQWLAENLNLNELVTSELSVYLSVDYNKVNDEFSRMLRNFDSVPSLSYDSQRAAIHATGDSNYLTMQPDHIVVRVPYTSGVASFRNVVCVQGFEAPDMTLPQYRSLQVNFRSNIPTYLMAFEKDLSENSQERSFVAYLLQKNSQINVMWETVNAARATGMHSNVTQINSYRAASILNGGGRPVRVVHLLTETAAISLQMMQVLFKLPLPSTQRVNFPEQHRGSLAIMRETLSIVQLASMDNLSDEQIIHRIECALESSTPTGQRFTPMSAAQRQGWLDVAKTTKNLVIADSCGGGKTLTAVGPYMLPTNYGLFVLIVCPLKSTVSSHAQSFAKLGINYEIYSANGVLDQDDGRFLPQSFTNNVRPANGKPYVILALSDRFREEQFQAFIDHADTLGRLACVILDEAHQVVLSENFREVMRDVQKVVRSLRARVIMLSGTLPLEIRETVVERLGIGLRDLHVVENTEDRLMLNRRVVHSVSLGKGETYCDVMMPVLNNWRAIGRAASAREGPVKRRIAIVFTYTKKVADEMFRKWSEKLAEEDDTDLLCLDSETPEEEREESMRLLFRPLQKHTILFCTNGFGEGLDLPLCDLVVIAGGTHNGLLEVVQMASRVGRGRIPSATQRSMSLPQVVFIYAPYLIWTLTGSERGNEQRWLTVHEKDEESVNHLLVSHRESAKDILGYIPMVKLFKESQDTCSTVALEKHFLRKEDLTGDCNGCSGCLGRQPPLLLGTRVKGLEAVEIDEILHRPLNKLSQHRKPKSLPEKDAQQSENAKVILEANAVVRAFKGKCPACGTGVHFPNQCTQLKQYSGTRSCYRCFDVHHQYRDIEKAINDPENKKNPETMFEVVRKCAVVVKNCEAWKKYKPCMTCWMNHELSGDCDGRHTDEVRCMVLSVYYDVRHREKFIGTISASQTERERVRRSWQAFITWILYEGCGQLGHIYRLLAYCNNVLKTRRGLIV